LSTTTALVRRPHRGYRSFIKEFVSQPLVIGAVAPSSRFLARKMLEGAPLKAAGAVVEYGPGTGAFTDHILRGLSAECRYLAIELNPAMARLWRDRHPGRTLYRNSVANVERLCRREGIEAGGVDLIFSGLPWASFPDELQEQVLEATLRVLRPGGQLITFGYRVGTWLPKGRRFYQRLPRYFADVRRSEWEWRNLPPAFVVRCTK
jgi:phosphatidylethanolamine/phosphatidyl-N-methylethanolamine N-methyltransferase